MLRHRSLTTLAPGGILPPPLAPDGGSAKRRGGLHFLPRRAHDKRSLYKCALRGFKARALTNAKVRPSRFLKREGSPPLPPPGGERNFPPEPPSRPQKGEMKPPRQRPKSVACLDVGANVARKGPDGAQEGKFPPGEPEHLSFFFWRLLEPLRALSEASLLEGLEL